MNIKERFIAKSKKFRLHFQLTEEQIDLLLLGKNLIYKGFETQHRIMSLELEKAYPLIYGLAHYTFMEDKIEIRYGMICQKQKK